MDRETRDPFDLLDEIEKALALDAAALNWTVGRGRSLAGAYDIRHSRLTPLGKRLYRRMSGGFDCIETAIVSARESTIDTVLRVSALPLFTSAWLIPRLERFDAVCAKARLKISIEIDTSSALTDFATSRVDVAIRNVMRPDVRLVSRKLVDLSAIPLCTPRVARSLSAPPPP